MASLGTVTPAFSAAEVARFQRDGALVVPGLMPAELVDRMRTVTLRGMADRIEPLELEAELRYPGSPTSTAAEGGRTIRRLKHAQGRDPVFTEWMLLPPVINRLRQLLGPQVVCPLAHHNCVMTKNPRYSSQTGWHQDIRYWSFTRPELVSVWIALGQEFVENGCLRVIAGSHRLNFEREQFDDALFFRDDLPINQPLLARAESIELKAGDVLFFHAKTLHAAGKNQTDITKLSAVFTFRPADNPPLPDSRSSGLPELYLPAGPPPDAVD